MPERDHQPIVVNAGDIQKLSRHLKKTAWSGEHGGVEDPDIFEPISIGSAPTPAAVSVAADPHGARLITANPITKMGLDEVDSLINALTEARDYLEIHQN